MKAQADLADAVDAHLVRGALVKDLVDDLDLGVVVSSAERAKLFCGAMSGV